MSDPTVIQKSVEQTNVWLDELAGELGTEDRREAYRVLRAYLHAVRDRLPIDETAQLAAQLSPLIRGIYYEGWDPSSTPRDYHDFSEFLDRVAAEASLDGETAASYAAGAAARVLRHHVSAGEIDDIRANLPQNLQPILG